MTSYDTITKSDYNLKTKEVQTNTYNKPATWDSLLSGLFRILSYEEQFLNPSVQP